MKPLSLRRALSAPPPSARNKALQHREISSHEAPSQRRRTGSAAAGSSAAGCGAADVHRKQTLIMLCNFARMLINLQLCVQTNGSATSAEALETTSIGCEMAQMVHQNHSVPLGSSLEQLAHCNLLVAASTQQAVPAVIGRSSVLPQSGTPKPWR